MVASIGSRISANQKLLDYSSIMNTSWLSTVKESRCELLGTMASTALIAESTLTPKPALVDKRGSGAHSDLTLDLLLKSAMALEPFFQEMAQIAYAAKPSQELREKLADCGRRAEVAMYGATGGSNSHRGAIWCLGLLVAGASILKAGPGSETDVAANGTRFFNSDKPKTTAAQIAEVAAEISIFEDRKATKLETHGALMQQTFGTGGAKREAHSGFHHVIKVGLPHLQLKRLSGAPETACRLDTLLAIMSHLDDTCLLYRGGKVALQVAKVGASEVLALGGTNNPEGMSRFFTLDRELLLLGASPGGSADLLAASLFLDSLTLS